MDKTNCAIFINWIQKKQTIDKHNRWISKKLCYVKEVKHKRLQITWFQWYEILEKRNHTDRKQICSCQGPGQGKGLTVKGTGDPRMTYLHYCGSYTTRWASQVAQQWQLCLPMQESWAGSILGSGKSSGEGNGNPLQYSCLEKSHGQRSLAGHSAWGCKRVGQDWAKTPPPQLSSAKIIKLNT